MMSWQPSGSGFFRASRLSRTFSGTSPVKRRYRLPRMPCARRARSSRRGVHQAHSSVDTASHSSAATAAAAAAARIHWEAAPSIISISRGGGSASSLAGRSPVARWGERKAEA
ncbi:Os01g0627550, partial [Oryza sativa Japonica Group]